MKSAAVIGAATALGGSLAGCQEKPGTSTLPAKWDQETDVLVIGLGLAGAVTALAAEEAGADVLVIEKMDEEHSGGNSKVSGNMIYIPGNAEDGVVYFKAMNEGHMYDISDEMVQTWINGMLENKQWIDDNLEVQLFPVPVEYGMGPELPHLPGAATQQIYMVNGQIGNGALYLPVLELVKSKKVKILYETAAYKLITDNQDRVIGALTNSAGKEMTIKAKKGVVLTCGGFEFNEAMKANYLRGPIYGMGTVGNTGDGIRMAQALGADLWHMNNAMGPISHGFLSHEFEGDYPEALRIVAPATLSYFYTNKHGKRFMDETRPHDHGRGWDAMYYYDGNKGEFPQNPFWCIFDQSGIDAGPLAAFVSEDASMKMGWAAWYSKYIWSADNSEEVKKGWIIKGDTVKDLAQKLDMDVSTLTETFEKFNAYAEAGSDEDFGRTRMAALVGPFYAISLVLGMVNTQGGPKRNHKAQVLHVEGHPIPRLYSAGECGSVYAWQYQGGGNLGECLAFGRIAGKNAAAEESI